MREHDSRHLAEATLPSLKSHPATGFLSQLGLALVVLRQKSGLTARALAAKAGVGKSQLSKYENGRESSKLETLARLLDVLDVEPLAFFYLLQLLHRGASEERLEVELVLSGAAKTASSGGEEAAAFLRVLESLLGLHRAVVKAQVSVAGAALIDSSSSTEPT